MKTNLDLFIRYLDNDLSVEEKEHFENRLQNEKQFYLKFDEFKKLFFSSKENIKADERYFSTLIPNAKKMYKKSKMSLARKLSYSLPAVFIGIFFLIQLFSDTNSNTSYNFEEMLISFSEDEELTYDLLSSAF